MWMEIQCVKNGKGRLKTRNPIFRRPLFQERIKSVLMKPYRLKVHSLYNPPFSDDPDPQPP